MNLPTISIRRHVLTTMISAVLVLFGLISYYRLGVDRFPSVDLPIVAVTTTLPGANPDVIDASITNVIETAVNSVPGIDHIESKSSPGASLVALTFNLDKNVDVAFNEVQAKINQVIRQLPNDADPPIVAKVEVGAAPIMWLSLSGDRTLQQLNNYARTVIKKKLETIDGVGEVRLGGERERTIRLNLHPEKMAAFGLTPRDVMGAVGNEHFMMPGGFMVSGKTENLIKLDLEYHNPQELAKLIVMQREGAPVRLGDIADIEDGLADYRQVADYNGKPTIGIGIVKVSNANTVAIVDQVKQRLETEIRPELPPGVILSVASDDSSYVLEMVNALQEHLLLGIILTALVVWAFLKSIRSTLIIALAIPVSLLGAVAVMYFFGFTINTMTLLALLLLIGVVVDDSIVVLENVFRHRESIDPDPESAAVNGTRQVVFAVLAATLSLVSIFAPVIFMGGIIGRFFQSFAVVVTFGVMVSWFVSMTMTPMLCARFLKVEHHEGGLYYWMEQGFRRMESAYRRLLEWALHFRWSVVLIALAVVFSSGFFFTHIGKGFVPEQDEGRFLVMFKTPLGSNIDYTADRMHAIEAVLARHKDTIASDFSAVGISASGQVNEGMAFVRMTPRDQREQSQQALLVELRKELGQIPGVQAFPAPVPIVGGARGEPLQFTVSGPNLQEVAKYAHQLEAKLAKLNDLGRIDLDLQLELPQYKLSVDRTRAADLGFSTHDIATAINLMIGGYDVAKYNDDPGDGERYNVRMKAADGTFTAPADLDKLYLRTPDGKMVRIDTVAQLKPVLGPAVVSRYDMQYAANFFGSPNVPLGTAVEQVRDAAKDLLPLGYTIKFKGQGEEMVKTVSYMGFAFVLAIVLLYMVLASQFNSFMQPFVIMIAQPLAMIGGVAALWLTGNTLNIYSMIGLVLLIGLVAKNSILLVDLTNQFREEGKGIKEALLEACPIRLRPVLMTSLTIILALLPAALGIGAGAETNGPLAIAVIGGMVTSTLLTLVVVPAVYSLLGSALLRITRREPRGVMEGYPPAGTPAQSPDDA